MEHLYSGRDMRATLLCPKTESPSQTLFVTFSNFRGAPSLEDDGFGQDLLNKMGIPAIHIVTAGNTWFQSPEVFDLAQTVLKTRSKFAKAVGYGSSMGGYGAMMLSNLLRLDATLTLSPQYSIQPEKVQGDSRWANIASELNFVFDDMNIGMSATARHNLFYDPCTADKIHAQLFEKRGANCFALPHSGHSSAGFLQQVGMLTEIVIVAAQDPMTDFKSIHEIALERSARSALYAFNLGQAQKS